MKKICNTFQVKNLFPNDITKREKILEKIIQDFYIHKFNYLYINFQYSKILIDASDVFFHSIRCRFWIVVF